MKSSRRYVIGLVALIALTASTPYASARSPHHPGIPFIVGAACPQLVPGSSSQVTVADHRISLLVGMSTKGSSGFEMYCSHPGMGTLPSTASATFLPGTLTFKITGAPTGSLGTARVVYTDNSTSLVPLSPLTNGSFTIPANVPQTPGSRVRIIYFVCGGQPGGIASAIFSNFVYNCQRVAYDLTIVDQAESGGPFPPTLLDYCQVFD